MGIYILVLKPYMFCSYMFRYKAVQQLKIQKINFRSFMYLIIYIILHNSWPVLSFRQDYVLSFQVLIQISRNIKYQFPTNTSSNKNFQKHIFMMHILWFPTYFIHWWFFLIYKYFLIIKDIILISWNLYRFNFSV